MEKYTSILDKTAWWPINKAFARKHGLDAAILIMDLSSKQSYFRNKKMLDFEGYFFNEKKDIERDTTLSFHKQSKAISELMNIDCDFFFMKKCGIPSKIFYKIDLKQLDAYLLLLHNEMFIEDEIL